MRQTGGRRRLLGCEPTACGRLAAGVPGRHWFEAGGPEPGERSDAMTSLLNERPFLRIEAAQFPHQTVLRCEGEIDAASADCLLRGLDAAILVGAPEVEVDLRGVSFLDSTAMHVLLEAHHLLHCRGRSLLVRATPRAAKLFHILQIDRLFPVQVDEPLQVASVH
jgi:anti-sigma B factor antagonist